MPAAEAVRADELLLLAVTAPEDAVRRSRELLASGPSAWLASVAHQAAGLAFRQRGDLASAVPELRAALRQASRSRDADRVADVRATLGVAYAMDSRTVAGLRQLDAAVDEAASALVLARVSMRRGYVLSAILGRHAEARADYARSLAGFRAAGDRLWEARTLNNMSVLDMAVGNTEAAEDHAARAESMFTAAGQQIEAAQALHNRGRSAFNRGDLPTSLRLLDAAAERFVALSADTVALSLDRGEALLTAGLLDEARTVLDAELARAHIQPVLTADLQLRRSTVLLASGEPVAALADATAARTAYVRQHRDWFARQARLAELRATWASRGRDRRQAATARAVAVGLEAVNHDDAAEAWLLAARLAGDAALLREAARFRRHPVPLVRVTGWLALGLAAEHAADPRGVYVAGRRGLDELDRHRATLGSSELRALSSRHGADLAALVLRTAVGGSPRRLLGWSERWRAASLSRPPTRPGGTPEPVAALRDNARRLREAREEGDETVQLEAERRRLETALRSHLHHTTGTAAAARSILDVPALVDTIGSGTFVELVEIGGTLHALVVSGGRVRRHEVGPVASAEVAATAAAFAMRQAARGRPARLAEAGTRLERALLGLAARRLRGPVVISPTSRLHGVPWGLLPSLADVPHSVVPSAALWLRALDRSAESERRVFVSGPGLTTGGSEILVVAPRHAGAVVLRDAHATVDDVLAALDGAGLAHLAAHGHFRADSPLFSSLDLADGPLAVHDFERLDRAPHRVVLSACDSGVLAPVGAGELLGLVSALLGIGTAGVVASVAVVNDEATVEVMVDVHAALDAGLDLAGALHAARTAAADDPTRAATAAAFLALGV